MSAGRPRAARIARPSALTKAGVAVALTLVAGYVDAIGWLTLDRVFIAQVSGNIMLLAVHLVANESGHVSLQADAIVAFFLGLVMTGSVIEIGMRRRWRRIFIAALVVEICLLVVFALTGGALLPAGSQERESADWPTYALIAVAGFAMGAQNTSLRMAGILSVWTTHMTGTLSGLSEELIVCVFALFQPRNQRKARGGFAAGSLQQKHPTAFKNIGQSAALLAAFFGGAVAGAAALKGAGVAIAMIAPLAVLVAVGVLDWLVPLTDFPSSVEQE
ncbi:MAG TPA: YoaK family protein [Stellaceae bacterium]|jgi:uncharacterized membrane protein YoaK (UPF0700 family)|nr:YoaK family protein [Stellaceae bacterium]